MNAENWEFIPKKAAGYLAAAKKWNRYPCARIGKHGITLNKKAIDLWVGTEHRRAALIGFLSDPPMLGIKLIPIGEFDANAYAIQIAKTGSGKVASKVAYERHPELCQVTFKADYNAATEIIEVALNEFNRAD